MEAPVPPLAAALDAAEVDLPPPHSEDLETTRSRSQRSPPGGKERCQVRESRVHPSRLVCAAREADPRAHAYPLPSLPTVHDAIPSRLAADGRTVRGTRMVPLRYERGRVKHGCEPARSGSSVVVVIIASGSNSKGATGLSDEA